MEMRNLIAGALLATAMATAMGSGAYAQSACQNYTIQRGDTLGSIADRALGSSSKYRMIVDANATVLANPDVIAVGEVIQIPCADGIRATEITSKVSTSKSMPAMETAASREAIRFLTFAYGDDPFSGVDLPKGGMVSEMAIRAVEIADPGREAEVFFIDDSGSHLKTLLPLHAFDVGFGWYRPNCDDIADLNAADQRRCTDFEATDPVFQDSIGFYAKVGSDYANAVAYEDLHGAKLCRPRGYFEFDLVQADLVAPNLEIVKMANQGECLRAVMDGSADLWSINVFSAASAIADEGLDGQVVSVGVPEIVLNSYMLIARDHPRAKEYVDMLNVGLREMVRSGEWYDIIQWHLTEQNKDG